MGISVLIPFKSDDGPRDRIFRWIRQRWEGLFPEAEVIVGENPGEFNRSRSINDAFSRSTGSVVIVADADTVFYPEVIERAIEAVQQRRTWVLPYEFYDRVHPQSTDQILEQPPTAEIPKGTYLADDSITIACSGVLVLPREAFEVVHGFDPRFDGWGYEDVAFRDSVDVLWAKHERILGERVLHLWHPPGLQFSQPNIRFNADLAGRYANAIPNPILMQNLVGER